jgi:hypothetical protein
MHAISARTMWIAAALSSGLLLTGCGASTEPAGQAPNPVDAVACKADGNPDDDVVPVKEITDDFGSYCLTTLDPQAAVAELDPAIIDTASLDEFNISAETAAAAYDSAVKYLANTALDSEVLDVPNAPALSWFNANVDGKVADSDYYRSEISAGNFASLGLAVTQFAPQPINRTGEARSHETTITSDRVFAEKPDADTPARVTISLEGNSHFHVADADLVTAALRNGTAPDADTLKAMNPALFDQVDDTGLHIRYTVAYSFDRSDPERITAANGGFAFTTEDGFSITSF